MTTMIRGAAVVALWLLVACSSENSGDKISQVSLVSSVAPSFNGPTRYYLAVEFTMPRRFPMGVLGDISMTDTSGRRFESLENTLSSGSDTGQRIGARFEVAEGSQFGVVHLENYDVDISSRRVTRRAAASAAP
jgi:hypothetical protein